MARQAGHGDIADKIRAAAKQAMSRLDMANILETCFKERPLETLHALSRWAPPEVQRLEVSVTGTATDVLRELNGSDDTARRTADGDAEVASESGAVRH